MTQRPMTQRPMTQRTMTVSGSLNPLDRLTRYWWVLALTAVLGGAGGVALSLVMPPIYRASAYVIVVPSGSVQELSAISVSQAYGRIIEQPEILGNVAAEVGSSVEQLQQDIQGSTSPESPLVVLTASAGTAERAAEIANAAAESLVTFGNNQRVFTGMELAVFSAASSPPAPASPVLPLNAAIGTATGLLVACLALLTVPTRPARRQGASMRPPSNETSGADTGFSPAPAESAPERTALLHPTSEFSQPGDMTNGLAGKNVKR
jgi:capsular polysaccharide biosynthesis protein